MNRRLAKWSFAAILLIILLPTLVFSPGCTALMPVISSYDISPAAIAPGQSAIINWNVSGANSVVIEPIGIVSGTGSKSVAPGTTTVYTITAENLWGRVSKAAVLTIKPPPITIDFKANPSALLTEGSAILTWNVTGASSILIDPGIGQVAASGTKTVNPTSTTAYTLTAVSDLNSVKAAVTVVVNQPITITFTANPVAVFAYQGSILQWNVTGATRVSIDQGIGEVAPSSSQGVIPNSSTVYTLTATGPSGSMSKSVVVTVTQQSSYFLYNYYYPYPWFR
jgi:hypothetical protein